MNRFLAALSVEFLKARRSLLPGLTLLGISLAPLMGGLFMKILQDPAWAERFALLTTKARASSAAADWPTYLGLLTQATAIGGFCLFSIDIIWLYGREYSDRTVIDLLALPISRTTIVLAKFVVAVVWAIGLVIWLYGLGLAIGALLGLPEWSASWLGTLRRASRRRRDSRSCSFYRWPGLPAPGVATFRRLARCFCWSFCRRCWLRLGWERTFPGRARAGEWGSRARCARAGGGKLSAGAADRGNRRHRHRDLVARGRSASRGISPTTKKSQTNLTNGHAVPYTEGRGTEGGIVYYDSYF